MPETVNCDPALLAKAAACYCYTEPQFRSVLIYLLAQIAGHSSTPAELARKAACYCFDQRTAEAVTTLLLAQLAGDTSTPAEVGKQAACFCVNEQQARAITIYLLLKIWGSNLSPSQLARAAACFYFDPRTAEAVIIYLLCAVVNGSVHPCTLPSKATTPSPVSGASDVSPLALVLSWVNGGGATSYDVWFNGSFMGNQAGLSFSPGVLACGSGYAWRVDAVNACGTTTGDAWIFSTIICVPVNTALPVITGTAQVAETLSGSNGTWTNSPTGYTYRWLANGVAIGGATANTFLLTSTQLGATITFEVTASNAGGSSAPATSAPTSAVLPLAPSKATTPSPANAATGVLPYAPTLSWVNGGGATSYDVWFNGSFIHNQAGTTYAPGALAFNTAYTWRIDAVNAGGTTTGDTWGFTTVAAFSFAPATSTIAWTDVHGANNGNLAFFNANADFLSVSSINLDTQSLTAISNLAAVPALVTLHCATNSLTTLDISGCPNLAAVYCDTNSITTLDISHNPLLTVVSCQVNTLSVAAVNTILAQLVTFGLTGGTVYLNAQTPAAPPSAGPPNGIVAKAALLAETPAWAVLTD